MKKGVLISLIALALAAIGILIAAAAFFKKQDEDYHDELDYDFDDFDDDYGLDYDEAAELAKDENEISE